MPGSSRALGRRPAQAVANELDPEAQEKVRIGRQIAPGKAPWLRQESEHPFQSVTSHPHGRGGLGACYVFERRTNADQNGWCERTPMATHPAFLFGASKSHPN